MNPYQHATDMGALLLSAKKSKPVFVPGLAPTSRVRGDMLGATLTQIGGDLPSRIPVMGAPSVHLLPRDDGSVLIEAVRSLQYVENLTDEELKAFGRVGEKMVAKAESLSKGALKQAELNRRGNPYGRGRINPQGKRRRGLGRLQGRQAVSNMSVLNEQSGDVAKSWFSAVTRGKGQVATILGNSSDHAVYTATGTKYMKAHGPYTAAVIALLPELNEVSRRLGILGYQREMLMRRMGGFE